MSPNGGNITITQNYIGRTRHADTNSSDGNKHGVFIDSVGPALANNAVVKINENFISGNTTAGVANDSTVTVDATNNWWGSADGPNTPANTFKTLRRPATASPAAARRQFVPWLADGVDSMPAVAGFQHANGDATTPVVTTGGDQTATEGIAASINLGSFTDSMSATGMWHVTVDFGDGSPVFSEDVNADGLAWQREPYLRRRDDDAARRHHPGDRTARATAIPRAST